MTAALISIGVTVLGALLTALGFLTKMWIGSLQEDLHILGGALSGVTDTLHKQNEKLTTFHIRLTGVETELRSLKYDFGSWQADKRNMYIAERHTHNQED